MAIKVYLGKQTAEKQKATQLIDAGATDFSVDENISSLESEVFNDLSAKGDSVVGKIEVNGSIPLELSLKVFEELLGGLSYLKQGNAYKLSKDKPSFYTVVLSDTETNEKWEYVDCVINSFGINVAIGAYVKATMGIIGKTYEIGTGTVTGADRGESLRCLYAGIKLDGADVSEDIEGVDISVDNGIEAKGSLNSLYNTKIRRIKQVETKINIQKNEYEQGSFKSLKDKMIAGTAVNAEIKLGIPGDTDKIVITVPKCFINSNKRGDYKGAGTHEVELQASVNNSDKTHLLIKIKGEDE